MITKCAFRTVFLFFFLTWMLYAERPMFPSEPVRLISSSDQEVIVEYIAKSYIEHIMLVEGKPMIMFEAPLSGSTSEAGKPQLPIEAFLVALPPGKRPSVEVIESKFEIIEKKDVAPSPTYSFTEEGEAIPEYTVDPNFYEKFHGFYPSKVVELSEIAQIRDLNTAKIVINPLQYNPATKQLKKFTHLKLRIRFLQDFNKSIDSWQAITQDDPHYSPLYQNLIVNYQDAHLWRGVEQKQLQSVFADTTDDWYALNRTYYRIPVITDGIYKLRYADLLAYGIDLVTLDNTRMALYYKGKTQPLRVETSDENPQNWYVEFYANRNYGVNSYFDRYNDTSQYFLTWNDATPKRFSNASVTASTTTDTVKWFRRIFQQERDANYFFGVTQNDILNTDDVQGEGWYWNDFSSGTSRNFTFTIDTVQRGTGAAFQLRVRLHGMTLCQSSSCRPPSRHRAIFRLNNTIIDSIDWTDNNEIIFTKAFNETLLRTGSNTLNIRSRTWSSTDSNITKFYLDWFEIIHSRPLQVIGSALKFSNQAPASFDTLTFVVDGIPIDSATVYDLTGNRRITNVVSLGSQRIAFTDTVTGVKEYIVVREAGKMLPLKLDAKTFRNIRVNTTGADYLIITHALFRNEAEQLAQHRSSVQKLRTSVIDVQDIYDEFNFGHLEPKAIRSFLKHAYYFWKRPSPTYVVMFGDASWDYKKNLTTSVKQNYVPSFGNPPSDNAFVSFDSVRNYLPYLLIGRIPVESPTQASQVIQKIINYERPPIAEWNKKFLFITGGNTPSEKFVFNAWSDNLINRFVKVPPIGGDAVKVYKTSDAIIDGENRQYLQDLISSGIVFINFIGHSGGRVWNVNAGSPYDLQNTNGQLPFVSSVSCNIGFFSDPRSNVLSEDYLLANNRGGIAAWAASSIGYGSIGYTLVDKFLDVVKRNYSRDLGTLTTISRLHFWMVNSTTTPLVIQTLQLHPLIGDPLTQLAIPLKPDFDITAEDVVLKNNPPTSDSSVTLSITVRNLGLMAGSQILLSVRDSYTDEQGKYRGESDIVPPFYINDFASIDSVLISWNVRGKPGNHLITVTIDPNDEIPELNPNNNSIKKSFYIYRNQLLTVKPNRSGVLSSTPTLTLTVPTGRDTTPLTYTFEVDTTTTFSSSAKITSPPIVPGKVSASWTPSSLNPNNTYYWRGRSSDGIKQGAWAGSSFFLTPTAPAGDTLMWQQATAEQFQENSMIKTSLTPNGITMFLSDSTKLYARSVGARYNQTLEFYSELRVNNVIAFGLWWENSWSYLGGRFEPVSGSYVLKGFDLLKAGFTDSLLNFIDNTPTGNYIMLAVVRDGRQNMTEALYQRFEQLGSTQIRLVTSGQSWCMISRKGDGTAIIEDYQPTGIAIANVTVANLYRSGTGTVLTPPIGPAQQWYKASWDVSIPPSTILNMQVLGIKNDGTVDTVMSLPVSEGNHANLTAISAQAYPRIQLFGKLLNTDGLTTPILRRWNVLYTSTPELAISGWTFLATPETVQSSSPVAITLDVYNIGYNTADSVLVSIYVQENPTRRYDVVINSIEANNFHRIQTPFVVGGMGWQTLVASVAPKLGVNDLISDNNKITIPIYVRDFAAESNLVRVFFDGIEIRDGDYVSPKPKITIDYKQTPSSETAILPPLELYLDGSPLNLQTQGAAKVAVSQEGFVLQDSLADGWHTLEVVIGEQINLPIKKLSFQVLSVPRLMQVHNYPNPFSSQTVFTFVLTGSRIPEEVRIKIFTIAGRLIRQFDVNKSQLQLGFNRIAWDGRDTDGNEIANGTYFYKVIMKSGNENSEVVKKLARIR